jgi:hypothetical protein
MLAFVTADRKFLGRRHENRGTGGRCGWGLVVVGTAEWTSWTDLSFIRIKRIAA